METMYCNAKNTGMGAVNIPWCGRHIKFDDEGNYPDNCPENTALELDSLRNNYSRMIKYYHNKLNKLIKINKQLKNKV